MKLAARGLQDADVAAALDNLARVGLQDDLRFARAYVRYRSGRGYGPRRIAQELRQRGVDDALSGVALGAAEHDWFELAHKVRQKKFCVDPDSFTERARQTRFMQYRGFDSEQIRYALGQGTGDENC